MKKAELTVRYLLVLMLVAFGANKFLHFLPQPEAPPEGGEFLGALAASGYIFPAVGGVFLAAALLLACGRVVLGIVLVAPIAVNILGYHLTYDLPGTAAGGLLTALLVLLAIMHGGSMAMLFRSNMTSKDA